MKNLALVVVAVLGSTVLATAAPTPIKLKTVVVKEVALTKPVTHKTKKAKKEAVKVVTTKIATPKAEVKK
jgi:hypothetical protein